jgi:hypothetical protein
MTTLLPRSGMAPLRIEGAELVREFDGRRFAGKDRNRCYVIRLHTCDGGYAVHVGYRTRWEGESDYDWSHVGTAESVAAWLTRGQMLPPSVGFPPLDVYADRQAALLAELRSQWDAGVQEILDDPVFAVDPRRSSDVRGVLCAETLCAYFDAMRPPDDECRRILDDGGWNGMPRPGDEDWDRVHPDMPWAGLESRGICAFRARHPHWTDTQVAIAAQVLANHATGWSGSYPVEDEPPYERLWSDILRMAGGTPGDPVSISPTGLPAEVRAALTRATIVFVERWLGMQAALSAAAAAGEEALTALLARDGLLRRGHHWPDGPGVVHDRDRRLTPTPQRSGAAYLPGPAIRPGQRGDNE